MTDADTAVENTSASIASTPATSGVTFLRHGEQATQQLDWEKGPEQVRKALAEALGARNVAFLLGAGCSSMVVDEKERGISTMMPLAKEFCHAAKGGQPWAFDSSDLSFLAGHGLKLDGEYVRNLERLMETLHALRFVLQRSDDQGDEEEVVRIEGMIGKVQAFLWERCTAGLFSKGDDTVLELYESFYRRLVLRDRSLPRPWIFTTNYDLFNERAMDRLGLPYANGFSGVVERRFNPSTFRYALAEQLDISNRKWSAVDGFVYLCKLHGSISWTEDDHGLFPIRETWPQTEPSKVMIFPTPAKQNSSLGSPYSDLFREFQSRIVREQSVLITMGFAFGDEHINNIIYQALTIPTFRLIIFAHPDSEGDIAKLRALSDPRIWIIGGPGPQNGPPAHYFSTIVKHLLPRQPSDRIDDAVKLVLQTMAKGSGSDKGAGDAD
ncbi:SIR2 family protein [Sinorhizobium medicae]|uniref:SIR2 family protein n=1 Tax=Sinorhizobium medicae TaxID=110321 RepID=UPI000FD2B5BD|nr:SIR2 family protein [Sinorhizobium medicae]RVJ59508.1 SIR2 family protein [Sinorhizobium medicae]